MTSTETKLTNLWNKYNLVRTAGDKKKANSLLAAFIDLLKNQDKEIIKNFADTICIAVLDADTRMISTNGEEVSARPLRIQHPFFKEIILPVLKEQYQNNSSKHIRWIGQLEQFFYADNAATALFLKELNIEGYFETRHFLERSFNLEKSQVTLTLLLKRIAQDINYYMHELPGSVLAEPEDLDSELMIFRSYWLQSETKHHWKTLLDEWEIIAKHWRLFQASKDQYEGFEEYLQVKGVKARS